MREEQEQGSSFGDWMRRQRKARDWTQADLAQHVGCALDMIKKIETAARRPSKQLASRIAAVLGIPLVEQEAVVRAARDALAPDRLPHPTPAVGAAPPQHYQLRTPLPDFIGHQSAIATLLGHMQQAAPGGAAAAISGVRGMGGVGKTELAVLVANRLVDAFPDAQVVVSLDGASPVPLPPAQALQHVIHAFMPDAKLPDDVAALQALYLSVLHGRRALILADDAHDAAQVRPLLPPAGCALLITSRQRFSLDGMATIDLEVLGEADAVALLRRICDRLSPADARRLAQACGYLPLALRISASLLHNDPALDIPTYLARLADEQQRLSQLRDPDDAQLDIAATLALSYSQLDVAMQQVFRQLGVMVADFGAELAQAVVAVGEGVDVGALLHGLLRRNLVLYDQAHERWRLHDLVRDVAVQQLEAAGEAEAARWRYAEAAVARAAHLQEQYRAGGARGDGALAAFDAERGHIDAAVGWAQRHAETPAGNQLLLDAALATRYIGLLRYDPRQKRIPLWDRARMAARCLGDRWGEGIALSNLGVAYGDLGEEQIAITYFEQRLTIAREIGDRRGEGSTLGNLGSAYMNLGEPQTAITYLEQGLVITREIGDRRGEGLTLGSLGSAYYDLGEPQTAITYLEQELAIARDLGDRRIEGLTLSNLGEAYTEVGDSGRAIAACEQALAIAREIGDRRCESYALSYLARAQAYQGELARATTIFAQALVLLQEVGDRWGEAECRWRQGLALVQQGEREQALPLLRASVVYEQEIGHAKVEEHAIVLARLEAGEELPVELRIPPSQRAIRGDSDQPTSDNAQP